MSQSKSRFSNDSFLQRAAQWLALSKPAPPPAPDPGSAMVLDEEEAAVDEFSLTEVPDDWEEHENVVEEGPLPKPRPSAYLRLDRQTRVMRGAITCPACKERIEIINPHALRDHHWLCLGSGHRTRQQMARVQKKTKKPSYSPIPGEFFVAEITDHALRDDSLLFLVRWEDPEQKPSWQPLDDFIDWDEQGKVKLIDGHVRSYVRQYCPELEPRLLKKQA